MAGKSSGGKKEWQEKAVAGKSSGRKKQWREKGRVKKPVSHDFDDPTISEPGTG